jgi:hypothetical protein
MSISRKNFVYGLKITALSPCHILQGREERKEFNGIPYFCSLTQGERRIKRIPPHPTLSRGVERE